ncbi:hypothetical protein RRG08_044120 [Elysia crispata]|uniref:Uncharacterized protein n=1 Tax=Elysia crispata TaxID=231223 RepID=A0AAE0Z7I4_9GAST|nr:hypothetical protein RRG08_044120 [Elysia crispata]
MDERPYCFPSASDVNKANIKRVALLYLALSDIAASVKPSATVRRNVPSQTRSKANSLERRLSWRTSPLTSPLWMPFLMVNWSIRREGCYSGVGVLSTAVRLDPVKDDFLT